jgi:hypothetical protein
MTRKAVALPMTLNVLIARLVDLREMHGGSMRVLLGITDESPDGDRIKLEPDPRMVDLASDWPDVEAWLADGNEDTKVVLL